MKIRPLDIDKMIRKDGLKEVYNHTLEGPGSLFDPNIFGQGEEKKYKIKWTFRRAWNLHNGFTSCIS